VWRLFVSLGCATHDLGLTSWRDFPKLLKARSGSGRGASPDSFFPSFRPAVAELTVGGTERFYENEKFTHEKFDKACAWTTRFHKNGAEYFCDTIPGYSS
jgi:hypothetical protein